jgi:penicillin-binding protein 1C
MAARIKFSYVMAAAAAALGMFLVATCLALTPVKKSLHAIQSDAQALQIVDRNGRPLTITYQNRWNVYDHVALHAIPPLLRSAFLISEDKRFFEHGGVDWRARGSALLQNWRSGRAVRGASTITEQVVRMINPRPRSLWSKWIEGLEAALLERTASKAEILEFYLNQVPFASNRRGVVQAARYYFSRDLSTLNDKEMLALAVLARAPSSYDLYKDSGRITGAIGRLAAALAGQGLMPPDQAARIAARPFVLSSPTLPVNAEHFAAYVRAHAGGTGTIHSTLDAGLQAAVQGIIDERVQALRHKNLHNAAALVADYTTGEILAWVVAGAGRPETPGGMIDALTVPRQPGSAQKPLLYALALDSGWTAATMIDDAPLAEAVGTGLHNFRNYSNIHYGRLPLREALANSLNIPALLTIRHVGTQKYLDALHRLGFESLDRGAEVYDEGLALGNGEVTLLELVQGFAAIANRGLYRPFRFYADDAGRAGARRIWSEEAASLIGNILSDSYARRLEFGNNSVLNLPMQTAAKTGTSTDYRDAWTVGYNHRYVVGIWMGNLDHGATDGITGAGGPALAFRSIFSVLNRNADSQPLWLSPRLSQADVCIESPHDPSRCYMRAEYFMPGSGPGQAGSAAPPDGVEIVKPTNGLQIALDPRIPRDHQKLPFTLRGLKPGQAVEWILNGEAIATSGEQFLWPVARGKYRLQARITQNGTGVLTTAEISYIVK